MSLEAVPISQEAQALLHSWRDPWSCWCWRVGGNQEESSFEDMAAWRQKGLRLSVEEGPSPGSVLRPGHPRGGTCLHSGYCSP